MTLAEQSNGMLLPSEVPGSLVGEDVALGLWFSRSPQRVAVGSSRWRILMYQEIWHRGDLRSERNVVMDTAQ
jgi:hypothetical protein